MGERRRIFKTREAIGVAVSSDYAYLADGSFGLAVIDIKDESNPKRVGTYVERGTDFPGIVQDVALSGNYAYVAVYNLGLRVVDISDPTNPLEVAAYRSNLTANALTVSGNYLYVSDVYNALHAFDISDPLQPQRVGGCGIRGSAGLLAVSGNYAYVPAAGLDVVDISNPDNPHTVGSYVSPLRIAVALSGHYAYLASDTEGLEVIDVGDPTNPRRLGGVDTLGNAYSIAISGGYAYVGDSYSGLQVIDISDPIHPQRVGGNSSFLGKGLAIRGGRLYLAAHTDGLVILPLFTPPEASALRLTSLPPPASGGCSFAVGGIPSLQVAIQRSPDMANWEDWQPLKLGSSPQIMLDASAGTATKRFYRAVVR
jgi:hypothetical protein